MNLSNLVDMRNEEASEVPAQKRRKSSFVLHHCDDEDENSHNETRLEKFRKKIKENPPLNPSIKNSPELRETTPKQEHSDHSEDLSIQMNLVRNVSFGPETLQQPDTPRFSSQKPL